jgi:putative nucleotidyltransferase with HDIG domain
MFRKRLILKDLKQRSFKFVNKLHQEFSTAQIYLVGGAVRDLLLGRLSKDIDFVVRGISAQKLERFLAKYGKVNLVGKSFGVFKFVPEGGDSHNPIDIALPRTEHSLGTGGYRDFDIQSDEKLSIEEDLSRRDFTINAMALDISLPKKIKVIDPFLGVNDLKKKIIRAVGNPLDRFQEDYSRMLRAIRFSCQTGFAIEKSTRCAIKDNITHLNDFNRDVTLVKDGERVENEISETRIMPYEVIAKEFLKAFVFNPVCAFDLFDELGVFKELIPEMLTMKSCPQEPRFHSEGDVWQHTRLTLDKLASKKFKRKFHQNKLDTQLVVATLLHDLGKPSTTKTPQEHSVDRIRSNEHDIVGAKLARMICERLKLSSPEGIGIDPEKISWLIQHHMILVHGNVDEMRESTIEKYFFNNEVPGDDLLKLSWVDIAATLGANGKPDFSTFKQMLKRINKLRKISRKRKVLPPAILSGEEIMEFLAIGPGKKIGDLKDLLREEQLTGRIKSKAAAVEFLKKFE